MYNLDVVLSVGYRTNSLRAIEFRKWATKVLRQHIISGYTINRAMISFHYDEFMKAVGDIKALLSAACLKIDKLQAYETRKSFLANVDTKNPLDHVRFVPCHFFTRRFRTRA